MVKNRRLYTSMIISLLIHALFIYLMPGITLSKSEDKIGSYTRVQLISLSPSATKKASKVQSRHQRQQAKMQTPQLSEMDPLLRAKMKVVRDIPVPSFPSPPPPEAPPLAQPDVSAEDKIMDRLDDEVIGQSEQDSMAPQPVEVMAKNEGSLPSPVAEDLDFEPEEPKKKVKDVLPNSIANIQWQGDKPRRILYQPDRPPTYPKGYQRQVQGKIRLKFWVDSQGEVVRVVPMQKLDPQLDAVASDYLRQYRFEPVGKKRRNEKQWGIIPFSFRLE